MFIAHLPAGYLLSRVYPELRHQSPWVMTGAILPDVDLLYFYLVDMGATHHHHYLTHRPALWLTLCILCYLLRPFRAVVALRALSLGCLMHMALDTVVGAINWVWPLGAMAGPLITVPATQDWWVMSFLTHWSFGMEVMICLCAGVVLWRENLQDKMKG